MHPAACRAVPADNQLIQIFSIQHVFQILSILVLLHDLVGLQHLFLANPAVDIPQLFQAGNLSV